MSEEHALARASPAARRVLVVDDEFDIADTYSMLFEFNGFEVTTAADGRQALALIHQVLPDIVVSDYMMPLMDGAELCRQLRQDPRSAQLPFILMSAAYLREDIDAPYDLFLRKPVSFDTLLKEVLRLIQEAPR